MQKIAIELPNKLSELILVALADLEAVENKPNYIVHMGHYHMSHKGKKECSVCFAGAIMAKSIDYDHTKDLATGSYKHNTAIKLRALDSVRTYHLTLAVATFQGKQNIYALSNITINNLRAIISRTNQEQHQEDADKFKSNMRYIATELAKINL